MGLIAWYPLNGNYKNYGLDGEDLTAVGSISFNSGKIGKALTFTTANTANRLIRSQFQQTSNLTICAWIKPSAYTDRYRYIFTQGRADVNSDGFGLAFISNDNKLSFRFGNLNWTYTFTPNEWIHFVFTIDENKEANMYINGEKVANGTVGTLPDYSEGNGNFTIGCFAYVSGYLYPATGAINDFRFYDEVLSVKQIKEIAKGLVVHYPLNSGYGNENLVPNLSQYTQLSPYIRKTSAVDGYVWMQGTTFICEPSTTYTIQVKSDGTCVDTHGGSHSASEKAFSIWLYLCNENTSKDPYTGQYDNPICLKNNNYSYEKKGNMYIWRYTTSSTTKYMSVRINGYSNGTDSTSIKFWDFKIEKGKDLTYPVPNEADDLYSQLGYDSTTMYDTSGFGNNAEKINTPIYTSDTALYDSCINFNQSGYLKNTSLNLYANELTICFWVKMPNTIITQHFLFSTHNDWAHNGVGMWRDNSTEKGYYLLIKSNAETTFSRPFIGINANTWTFISISYTGKQYSVYKNGSLYQTVDYGNDGQVYNPVLYLGNSLYNGTPSTETDESSMSDFRIYSTALSAEDIKQLYQTKAKIDKNGNLYCNQFIEIDNERNLLDTDDYWISGQTSGTYKQEKIECSDSSSGTATKITCTAAGSGGFYMAGHKVFDKTNLVNGKQYIVSLYVKSDNRTSVEFFVECASKQTKNTFTIGTEYKRINIVYTYSNTTKWNAFTSYGGWKVDENVYIHSIKVTEYNPTTHFKNNSVVETNSFIEIKSEEKCKIYKQDIQSNEIIEI